MKIVADAAIPYLKGVLEPYAEVVYLPAGQIDAAAVRTADALIVRTRTRCDGRLLAGSAVRLVATATIGYDHIDLPWCRQADIEVATSAGCNARGVLQWVAAVLGVLARRGGWMDSPAGRTLGVVGVGNVGKLVAAYARAWGFEVLCSDPPRECAEGLGRAEGFVPLEELAARADVVTFHPLLTRGGDFPSLGLLGSEFFRALKPGAAVLNASRGEVADPDALRQAARNGVALCLDTWCGEPALDQSVLQAALVATPHVAGYTAQGKAHATAMAVEAVARHFGLPVSRYWPGEVTPQCPRPIGWAEMLATVDAYYPVVEETARLKAAPERFEALREGYRYRQEYF